MKVAAGEEIRWNGETFRVLVVRPLAVELRGSDGDTIEVDLDEVQRHAEQAQGPVLPGAKLSLLEDELHSDLRQWVEAIERIEGAARGQRDDVIEQEVASLSRGLGKSVSVRTVERKLSAYRRDGVAGLADGRKGASRPSVDTRVVEAINVVLARQSRASTRSKSVALDEIALTCARSLVTRSNSRVVRRSTASSNLRRLGATRSGRRRRESRCRCSLTGRSAFVPRCGRVSRCRSIRRRWT